MKRLRYATRDELADMLAERTVLTAATCGDVLDQLAALDVPVGFLVKVEADGD